MGEGWSVHRISLPLLRRYQKGRVVLPGRLRCGGPTHTMSGGDNRRSRGRVVPDRKFHGRPASSDYQGSHSRHQTHSPDTATRGFSPRVAPPTPCTRTFRYADAEQSRMSKELRMDNGDVVDADSPANDNAACENCGRLSVKALINIGSCPQCGATLEDSDA